MKLGTPRVRRRKSWSSPGKISIMRQRGQSVGLEATLTPLDPAVIQWYNQYPLRPLKNGCEAGLSARALAMIGAT